MPTTRKKRERSMRQTVTAEAVEAYKSGDWIALHQALGLKPWECSPLDADGGDPQGGDAYAATIEQARELRAELARRV